MLKKDKRKKNKKTIKLNRLDYSNSLVEVQGQMCDASSEDRIHY